MPRLPPSGNGSHRGRRLPLIALQLFGCMLAVAVVIAAFLNTGNTTLFTVIFGGALALATIGGGVERTLAVAEKAIRELREEAERETTP